jgi:sugar phosphate permease
MVPEVHPDLKEEQPKSYTTILTATFLPHFSTTLAMASIGPLAPFIQAALGISRTQIGALMSFHSVGWAVFGLSAGGLVERSGIRLWILLCPVVSGIASFLLAKIDSFSQGALVFLTLGFIFAFLNPATTKAIIMGFPKTRRGIAIAIKQTGTPAGVFLASAALPVIAVSAGWERAMVFVAAVNIAVGVCGWFLYKEENGIPAEDENGCRRQGSFKKDFNELIHNSNFLLISILQGVFNISQFVIQSYLVLYLVEAIGYSAVYAGFVMAVTQLSGVFGRVLWGFVSDFVFAGKRVPTLQIVGLTTFMGLTGLALITRDTPAWIIWIIASMAGAGSIGFGGTSILLRAELAGQKLAATSTGMGMAIAAWGVLLGPPLFGFIVDTINSYRIAWELVAGVTLAATLLLRLINEYKPGGRADKLSEKTVAT